VDGTPKSAFFLHVMKTGGTTVAWQLKNVFPPDRRYPFTDGEPRRLQYTMLDELRRLTPERRRCISFYSGHFPFVATEIVEPDVTMTMLRDPIDRTVSILRHFRRGSGECHGMALEEIYEHPLIHPLFIRNYQAKLFAMTAADRVECHRDVIEIDDQRLRVAKETLERVDVVGLTHRHHEFLDELRHRFGWRLGVVANQRVSTEGWDVSRAFRGRIAGDNPAEMEFYEHAVALYERRRCN
jgi:hypothetical protein